MATKLTLRIKRSRSEDELDAATQPGKIRLNGVTWTKHPDYYFKDGSLTFLADDHAYRVHASVLSLHSVYWKEELGDYEVDQLEPKELEDVLAEELNAFFSVVYASDLDTYGLVTVEEWTSVLRVASLWDSQDIRSLAIGKLDDYILPFQRLVLARAHDIQDWVESAFEDLSYRAEPLSVEEARQLSVEDIIRITTARENALAPPEVAQAPEVAAPAPPPVEIPPLPKITSKFTREEFGKIAAALSKGHYEDILGMVTTRKLPAFYHALADFTDLYSTTHNSSGFTSHNFTYAVANPSAIPLIVKILAFVARRENPAARTLVFFPVSKAVQNKVDEARELWKLMTDARAKYSDFDLAWRSAKSQSSIYGFDRLLGCRVNDRLTTWDVYEERSTNLKRLIAALSADDVGLVH